MKGAAGGGRDAKDIEEVGGDAHTVDLFGLAEAGDDEFVGEKGVGGDARKGVGASLHVLNIGDRSAGFIGGKTSLLAANPDELFRLAVGERLEQHAADDGEDSGVGPDAESERQDRQY